MFVFLPGAWHTTRWSSGAVFWTSHYPDWLTWTLKVTQSYIYQKHSCQIPPCELLKGGPFLPTARTAISPERTWVGTNYCRAENASTSLMTSWRLLTSTKPSLSTSKVSARTRNASWVWPISTPSGRSTRTCAGLRCAISAPRKSSSVRWLFCWISWSLWALCLASYWGARCRFCWSRTWPSAICCSAFMPSRCPPGTRSTMTPRSVPGAFPTARTTGLSSCWARPWACSRRFYSP